MYLFCRRRTPPPQRSTSPRSSAGPPAAHRSPRLASRSIAGLTDSITPAGSTSYRMATCSCPKRGPLFRRAPISTNLASRVSCARARWATAPNRITLLRDNDGDAVADFRTAFLEGLDRPFGMALVGDRFYVGATDGVYVYAYQRSVRCGQVASRFL